MRNRDGFTLLELVAALSLSAVIGIWAAGFFGSQMHEYKKQTQILKAEELADRVCFHITSRLDHAFLFRVDPKESSVLYYCEGSGELGEQWEQISEEDLGLGAEKEYEVRLDFSDTQSLKERKYTPGRSGFLLFMDIWRMERMRKVKTRIKTDRFHGDDREGGSLLYVIFFITLLSVFACGFMAVSRYHIKMALKNRAYMEARLTTHMIHNSFCEAVSKGESDALKLLWNQYEGDLEDEEAEENENEDIPETEGAGADGITKLDADEIQDTNERQDADERQDTDLDLEDREYITEGTGSYTDEKGEPCEVRIRLKLEPVEEKAYVDTWTKISGFSMHLEGEVPLQDTP